MSNALETQVRKLIKYNQRMYQAEFEHAKKTGVRHYPNKAYFKALRKQKKLLEVMAKDEIKTILHALYHVTDELTRPQQLKPGFIDRASKKEAIEMLITVRYLHEYLEAILTEGMDGDKDTL